MIFNECAIPKIKPQCDVIDASHGVHYWSPTSFYSLLHWIRRPLYLYARRRRCIFCYGDVRPSWNAAKDCANSTSSGRQFHLRIVQVEKHISGLDLGFAERGAYASLSLNASAEGAKPVALDEFFWRLRTKYSIYLIKNAYFCRNNHSNR